VDHLEGVGVLTDTYSVSRLRLSFWDPSPDHFRQSEVKALMQLLRSVMHMHA
jgi:hypothetical protein